MLELCGKCNEIITNLNVLCCLDCNQAFHHRCLPEPEHGARVFAAPSPPHLLRPLPYRCPTCAACSSAACRKSSRAARTCRSCANSLCGACSGTGYGKKWAWACSQECAGCLSCGEKYRPGTFYMSGCNACGKKTRTHGREYGWCSMCHGLADRQVECKACCKRVFVHAVCSGALEVCGECFAYPDSEVVPNWFWGFGSELENMRTCYKLVKDGDQSFSLFASNYFSSSWTLCSTFATILDFRAKWSITFQGSKYNHERAFEALLHHAGEKPAGAKSLPRQNEKENIPIANSVEQEAVRECWKIRNQTESPVPRYILEKPVLRSTDNESVYIARSAVAGWGLFANKHFSCGDAIVEYKGEVIGRALSDHRERLYNAHPLLRQACYLFSLSAEAVIDATAKGNHARFINHSCEPNCVARILDQRIWIHARDAIKAGTELFYDYKFSDLQVKCGCGSKKCRGFI